MKRVIGIDPANVASAYCVFENGKPVKFDKIPNEEFFALIKENYVEHETVIFIEDIQSMGMAVGQSVFDTCKYIGRLQLLCEQNRMEYQMVKRTEIKLHHCNTTRAKDTNIRAALIERFGGKGTKKEPGFFFGIAGNDVWSATAIAIFGSDKINGRL
jgi:hypothetical protein